MNSRAPQLNDYLTNKLTNNNNNNAAAAEQLWSCNTTTNNIRAASYS
jgi:hypothetical protein